MKKLLQLSLMVYFIGASPVPDKPSGESNHRKTPFDGGRAIEESNADMKNGVLDRSISNIAAQLLDEEPSSISPGETNSENQAKVVNHIKGLLNDIVSNTIVDDDNMTGQSEGGVDSPTILQTVFNLDTNTIKDKESFIKVINAMKDRERQTTETFDTTTYMSVFENNEVKDIVKTAGKPKPSILDMYIEQYDEILEDKEETATASLFKSGSTTTTVSTTTLSTTTTSSTTSTTPSTTTVSTTSSTTTSSTTTTQQSTTTTQTPTLLERAGQVVNGGISGVFNGFASIGQAISQAASPFWIPIQLGRRKRATADIADIVKSQITGKDVFMNFLLFQKRIKAMNPEKLNEIIKGVVRNVINVGIPGEGGDYENLYDELIAAQVSELLLRPKPYSKESIDTQNISNNFL